MRRAGEVVRVAQGKLVVRAPGEAADEADTADEVPGEADHGHVDVGTELVDEELSEVGRVVDVFGPVARPYLAVVPADGVQPAELLGARLYAR